MQTTTTTTMTTTTTTPMPTVTPAAPNAAEPVPPPPPMVASHDAPPTPYKSRIPKSEFGIDLHLGAALIGAKDKSTDTGMAMLGGGLRFRPIPLAAIETDLDLAGGRDYNGLLRSELGFTINGLIFLNPRDRFQVYVLGGFGWAGATVKNDRYASSDGLIHDNKQDYSYFGVQGGAGLEWRLAKNFALHGDLRGFVRGRTDEDRFQHPEFVDANGRTTNTSGGALLTAGATIYF
jgi:hypothetical protein